MDRNLNSVYCKKDIIVTRQVARVFTPQEPTSSSDAGITFKKKVAVSAPLLIELLRDVLGRGMPFRFMAKGFSMSPFIRSGDLLTVSPVSKYSPRTGDVLAFISPRTERMLVHRVIAKNDDLYLTKGDNTAEGDGWFPKQQILGRVIRVERRGRRVFLGLGPERLVIAFLTRRGWLMPLLYPARHLWRAWHTQTGSKF